MAKTETKRKNKNTDLREVKEELAAIKERLDALLLIIPEESLNEYKNESAIRGAHARALQEFPAK